VVVGLLKKYELKEFLKKYLNIFLIYFCCPNLKWLGACFRKIKSNEHQKKGL
jgi:hypothetical protein